MNELTVALCSTVVPAAFFLAIAYPLRGQSGRMRVNPLSARRIRARLYNDRFPNRLPQNCWPGTTIMRHRMGRA